MPKIANSLKRGRGRPKTFDRDQALDVAMKMFWDRGFEGTCLDDLISGMGISSSSFYNSFGCKEELYREAVETYIAASKEWFSAELNAPGKNTRTAIRDALTAAAKAYTCTDKPCGCMISLAGTHLPPELDSVREMMARERKHGQSTFAARIRKGVKDGDLPSGTKVEALATYYSAVSQGMAVQARDGATRRQLQEIVELAMRAWPTSLVGAS